MDEILYPLIHPEDPKVSSLIIPKEDKGSCEAGALVRLRSCAAPLREDVPAAFEEGPANPTARPLKRSGAGGLVRDLRRLGKSTSAEEDRGSAALQVKLANEVEGRS